MRRCEASLQSVRATLGTVYISTLTQQGKGSRRVFRGKAHHDRQGEPGPAEESKIRMTRSDRQLEPSSATGGKEHADLKRRRRFYIIDRFDIIDINGISLYNMYKSE